MKQKLILLAFMVMVLAFFYLRFTTSRPKLREILVGSAVIKVDVADTIGKQRQGLSGRDSMPADQGMYFPMGEPALYHFWMKEMHFPLDILWIHAGKIVDISENVRYPLEGETPAVVYPKVPADAVLEVNADFTEKNNLKIGDSIQFDIK